MAAALLRPKGAYLSAKDLKGNSLLHIAVQNETLQIVKFLIQNECDVYATNNSGVSVLEMMKESKNDSIQSIAKKHE